MAAIYALRKSNSYLLKDDINLKDVIFAVILEQRIAYTDDKINEKIYALCGLTAEEVNVVEESE